MNGQDEPVVIYTDGGCAPNPGVGGWAAVMHYKDHVRELSGGEPDTTNNRMELTAVVEALRALRRPCHVEVYTDSQYVRLGITSWLPNWKRRGWKRKEGPLKNIDLWQQLDVEAGRHRIDWRWVRGHAGNRYNERCDQLASEAITRQRSPRRGGAEQ